MTPDDLRLLTTTIQALFTGFGIFILVTSCIPFNRERRKQWVIDHTRGAVVVVKWASLVCLLVWMVQLFEAWQSAEDREALMQRSTGPYALVYWVYHLAYSIVPQLFWIERMRDAKVVRVLIAILLLATTNMERIIILLSTFHRDDVPSRTVYYPLLFAITHQLIAVATLLALTHLLKGYRTNPNAPINP